MASLLPALLERSPLPLTGRAATIKPTLCGALKPALTRRELLQTITTGISECFTVQLFMKTELHVCVLTVFKLNKQYPDFNRYEHVVT